MKNLIKNSSIIVIIFIVFSCSKDDYNLNKPEQNQTTIEKINSYAELEELILEENNNMKCGFNIWSENCELLAIGAPEQVPFAGVYSEPSAILSYFARFYSSIDIINISSFMSILNDTTQSIHFRMEATVKATQKTFDLEFIYWFIYNSLGEISEIKICYDTENFTATFNPTSQDNYFTDYASQFEGQIDYDYTGNSLMIVMSGYEAFANGDPIPFEIANPNIEWLFRCAPEKCPYGGVFYGIKEVMQYFIKLSQNYALIDFEFQNIVAQGNRVDLFIKETMNTKPDYSGNTFSIFFTHSYVIENEKISSFVTTNDSEYLGRQFIE